MSKNTMRAVVFKEPMKVELEDRPVPKLEKPTDIIVKVQYSALCGSELHVFRGHQKSPTGFIMGHEFTGEVEEVGESIKHFKKGDKIVSPFTLSWEPSLEPQPWTVLRRNLLVAPNAVNIQTYTTSANETVKVRIPLADTTVFHAPPEIPEKLLVLMADIYPTGFFGARNAFKEFTDEQRKDAVVVLVGCGPVAMCALVNLVEYKPKKIIAVDSIQSRLDLAKSLGAEPWNFEKDREGLDKRVKELTDGRGADVVVEVVGLSAALQMGFELLRPWGIISSIGVHNGEIPWTGNQAYGKNLRIQMGRCPVRSIFPEALDSLKRNHSKLNFMADKIMPMSQAIEGYEIFEKGKSQKVVFEAQK